MILIVTGAEDFSVTPIHNKPEGSHAIVTQEATLTAPESLASPRIHLALFLLGPIFETIWASLKMGYPNF